MRSDVSNQVIIAATMVQPNCNIYVVWNCFTPEQLGKRIVWAQEDPKKSCDMGKHSRY